MVAALAVVGAKNGLKIANDVLWVGGGEGGVGLFLRCALRVGAEGGKGGEAGDGAKAQGGFVHGFGLFKRKMRQMLGKNENAHSARGFVGVWGVAWAWRPFAGGGRGFVALVAAAGGWRRCMARNLRLMRLRQRNSGLNRCTGLRAIFPAC